MPVSRLRQQIAGYLEVDLPVHLLVGDSWEYDVLEHTGTITDRFFPGTNSPCPFLQQGSRVNVYLARPAPLPGLVLLDSNLVSRSFINADGNEEWFTPRDLIHGRTPALPIDVDGDEHDSAEESTESMAAEAMASPSSEDVSDPLPLPRRRKNGERGRSLQRNTDVDSAGGNLDELIREQLREDARRSSSSAAEVPHPRASPSLSDSDYSARRTRSEALFEGYRRVKRTRTALHSRDAEQEDRKI